MKLLSENDYPVTSAERFELLEGFYAAVREDSRIGSTHISLYVGFLLSAHMRSPTEDFAISRDDLMQTARVSRKTYVKRIRELHEYGYIEYKPSPDPVVKSRVRLIAF